MPNNFTSPNSSSENLNSKVNGSNDGNSASGANSATFTNPYAYTYQEFVVPVSTARVASLIEGGGWVSSALAAIFNKTFWVVLAFIILAKIIAYSLGIIPLIGDFCLTLFTALGFGYLGANYQTQP